MRQHLVKLCISALAVVSTVLYISAPSGAASAKRGGTLTVLTINSSWPGLDPATNTSDSADVSYMDAIYGGLFDQLGNGQIVGDLATGYTISDHNELVTIDLRHNVRFSDGTPFNAAAVESNIERVLQPQYACICDADWTALASVSVKGSYTVLLHLKQASSTIVEALIGEAPNWVPSPTALADTPEAIFAQHPVGAGPFEVQSNYASTNLTLVRNPHYWDRGHPYLNELVFVTTPNDQSAYSALQAGTVQMALGITTNSIIQQAKSQFSETILPGVNNYIVSLNTLKPPFSNLAARQAVYYATNSAQILSALYPGFGAVQESEAGPRSILYEKKVPGYPAYDLAKAKALVQQIGGLSFTILTGTSPSGVAIAEALQNQWEQAGMTVTIAMDAIPTLVPLLDNKGFQEYTGQVGGIDPDVGIQSLANRVGQGPQSGVNDNYLNSLIARSEQLVSLSARQKTVNEIYAYVAKEFYAPILFDVRTAVIGARNLVPLGLNLEAGAAAFSPYIQWQNVAFK